MLLITGGTGYIGSHTAVAAVRAGHHVVVADNFSNSLPATFGAMSSACAGQLILERGDLTDVGWVKDLFNRYRFRSVIHFAALKAAGESLDHPLDYYENNVNSLICVLRSAETQGTRNLVFSSSAAVYGLPESCPVTEKYPIGSGNTPYGFSKVIGERLLVDHFRSGSVLHSVALRYFNPIGALPDAGLGELPKGSPGNLQPILLEAATGKRASLTVHGNNYPTPDGTCVRDYIHVMDVAEAHLAAIQWLEERNTTQAPEFFNIGTGRGTSVLELITEFQRISGMKLNVHFGPRRPGDLPEIWADVSKIKIHLGWQARRTIAEALADAWQWSRSANNSLGG